MRCAICDKLLIEPIKTDPRTGKLSPCDECQKVIQETIKAMEQAGIFEQLLPTITTESWEDMTNVSLAELLDDLDIEKEFDE